MTSRKILPVVIGFLFLTLAISTSLYADHNGKSTAFLVDMKIYDLKIHHGLTSKGLFPFPLVEPKVYTFVQRLTGEFLTVTPAPEPHISQEKPIAVFDPDALKYIQEQAKNVDVLADDYIGRQMVEEWGFKPFVGLNRVIKNWDSLSVKLLVRVVFGTGPTVIEVIKVISAPTIEGTPSQKPAK
ncbi:MAG: hypothetical protein HQM08_01355 [Candidatus Riflebacteria bacterium]|nr:hypothetical protein [Candidatus Riflebacteria bacterium]